MRRHGFTGALHQRNFGVAQGKCRFETANFGDIGECGVDWGRGHGAGCSVFMIAGRQMAWFK